MLYEPKVNVSSETYQMITDEVKNNLKGLDSMLKKWKSKYFCESPTMTLADIVVFNEISQYCDMCNINLDTLLSLQKWYQTMLQNEIIANFDIQMK